MEDPQEMGYISVDRFYPVITKVILQQKYERNAFLPFISKLFNNKKAILIINFLHLTKCFRYQLLPSADLLKAFQALDTDSKGYLTIEEAKKYFTQHGEAFAQV